METIDDRAVAELTQQGLSQRDSQAPQYLTPNPPATPRKAKGKPTVHQEFPFADELTQSWSEIQEVLDWWRERKQTLARTLDATRKRRRQTYHVEDVLSTRSIEPPTSNVPTSRRS